MLMDNFAGTPTASEQGMRKVRIGLAGREHPEFQVPTCKPNIQFRAEPSPASLRLAL